VKGLGWLVDEIMLILGSFFCMFGASQTLILTLLLMYEGVPEKVLFFERAVEAKLVGGGEESGDGEGQAAFNARLDREFMSGYLERVNAQQPDGDFPREPIRAY